MTVPAKVAYAWAKRNNHQGSSLLSIRVAMEDAASLVPRPRIQVNAPPRGVLFGPTATRSDWIAAILAAGGEVKES